MNYKQCLLVKSYGNPEIPSTQRKMRYVAWIPEELAKVGKIMDIKMSDGWWDKGWEIAEVWTVQPEDYVREHERDYLTQSEASDKFTPNRGLGL